MAAKLEELEAQSDHLRVPLSHAGRIYTLKDHIRLDRGERASYAERIAPREAP